MTADHREWLIERSTLPFKAGRSWSVRRRGAGTTGGGAIIELDDVNCEGQRVIGGWRVIDADGPDAGAEFDGGPVRA